MPQYSVVIDTNVMVSALLKSTGAPGKMLDLWVQGRFRLIVSQEILDEYFEVLVRKGIEPDLVAALSRRMSRYAHLVAPKGRLNIVEQDASDNKFLECAVEGNAEYIVSGDRHLLALKRFRETEIVTPTGFLKLVEPNL
jgi:putative PIN family toxin of toxin-antitoxin system